MAVQILRCAADLLLCGDPFPRLSAIRYLGTYPGSAAGNLAFHACETVGGPWTELQLLEAAQRIEEGSI